MDTKAECYRTYSISNGETSGVEPCVPSWLLDKRFPSQLMFKITIARMIFESCDKNLAFEKLIDCFGHAAANFIRNMFKHRDRSDMGYLWILLQQLRKRFITSQVAMK